MTDRPIIFSAPMVRALLEGRKTQTRRLLKKPTWAQSKGWPERVMYEQDLDGRLMWFHKETGCCSPLAIPQPKDRLWLKENWFPRSGYSNWDLLVDYTADKAERHFADGEMDSDWNFPKTAKAGNTVPSIFMPRWASRITLAVTDVRIMRLEDTSNDDALAEGVIDHRDTIIGADNAGGVHREITAGGYSIVEEPDAETFMFDTAGEAFADLWDSINGHRIPWEFNPWVVATTFEVIKGNIDHV